MANLEIKVDARPVLELFARLPASLRERGLRSGLSRSAKELQRQVREELSGRTLQKRTGRYFRSVVTTPYRVDATGAHISVKSDSRYAQTHERGAVIQHRKRQFLTVPFESTPLGLTVPMAMRQGAFIASGVVWSRAFTPGSSRGAPLFSFKASVRIPPRPIWSVVTERSQALVQGIVESAIARLIREEGK